MTQLETIAREIDRYAGAAGDIDPAVGMASIPIRMFVALRQALRQLDGVRP